MKSLGSLIVLGVALVCLFGWGANIVKLVKCDFEPSYKAECIRTIGIVVPIVGAVTGYMDIED